jgi:hypothetical protein
MQMPRIATGPVARVAPSQITRPNPIVPGAAAARGAVDVESMAGPFAREPQPAAPPPSRQTGPVPAMRQTGPLPVQPPASRQTGPLPIPPPPPVTRQTGPMPVRPPSRQTGPLPIPPPPPASRQTGPVPRMTPPAGATQPIPRPPAAAPAPLKPPPGMTDADVNTLYAKYVQAKQLVGEAPGPREREKLLKTINAQAPKIMEQYKAKGVDFSVVVKDNQVVIRAKPKT